MRNRTKRWKYSWRWWKWTMTPSKRTWRWGVCIGVEAKSTKRSAYTNTSWRGSRCDPSIANMPCTHWGRTISERGYSIAPSRCLRDWQSYPADGRPRFDFCCAFSNSNATGTRLSPHIAAWSNWHRRPIQPRLHTTTANWRKRHIEKEIGSVRWKHSDLYGMSSVTLRGARCCERTSLGTWATETWRRDCVNEWPTFIRSCCP